MHEAADCPTLAKSTQRKPEAFFCRRLNRFLHQTKHFVRHGTGQLKCWNTCPFVDWGRVLNAALFLSGIPGKSTTKVARPQLDIPPEPENLRQTCLGWRGLWTVHHPVPCASGAAISQPTWKSRQLLLRREKTDRRAVQTGAPHEEQLVRAKELCNALCCQGCRYFSADHAQWETVNAHWKLWLFVRARIIPRLCSSENINSWDKTRTTSYSSHGNLFCGKKNTVKCVSEKQIIFCTWWREFVDAAYVVILIHVHTCACAFCMRRTCEQNQHPCTQADELKFSRWTQVQPMNCERVSYFCYSTKVCAEYSTGCALFVKQLVYYLCRFSEIAFLVWHAALLAVHLRKLLQFLCTGTCLSVLVYKVNFSYTYSSSVICVCFGGCEYHFCKIKHQRT